MSNHNTKRREDNSDSDSVRTEDIESEAYTEEEAITVRLVDKDDIALRNSDIDGAGKGVFCKKEIEAGTILPYYAIVKKTSGLDDDNDDTYFMSVTYVNEEDKTRNIQSMVADGNPTLPALKKLSRNFRAASYVNEASDSPPNCVFVNNIMDQYLFYTQTLQMGSARAVYM